MGGFVIFKKKLFSSASMEYLNPLKGIASEDGIFM